MGQTAFSSLGFSKTHDIHMHDTHGQSGVIFTSTSNCGTFLYLTLQKVPAK